jgi:hypothetical protein
MIRALILAVVLGGFALAMTGCHAQGSVGGNDTSSMAIPR